MMYGGAWAEFNSVTVLGISLLLSSELKEDIDPELQRESLEYIQGCCRRLQGDLDAGKDDAVSTRERKVMDALLLRLGSCLRNPDGSRLELLDTSKSLSKAMTPRVHAEFRFLLQISPKSPSKSVRTTKQPQRGSRALGSRGPMDSLPCSTLS
jgi:hypothetical protein